MSQITVDGADVTDEPIDLKGQNAHGASRPDRPHHDDQRHRAGVAGSTSNYSVVVFPDDAARWTLSQLDTSGPRAPMNAVSFRIAGLPPNERYFAVAVDYLEEGEEQDAQFLERLRVAGDDVLAR